MKRSENQGCNVTSIAWLVSPVEPSRLPAGLNTIKPIHKTPRHKAQRGFAIVSAIFLLVVLAALGAFMVTFSNTQHLTSAQDVQGSRAYWAARAGLEWGIAGSPGTCPTSTTTTLTIDTFTVKVITSCKDYTEAAATPNVKIFQFTSTASSAGAVGSVGFIERSLSATMEK